MSQLSASNLADSKTAACRLLLGSELQANTLGKHPANELSPPLRIALTPAQRWL